MYSYMQVHTKYILVHTQYILICSSTYPVHTICDGVSHRWTAAELKKVIALLQSPEFGSKDIDPDLHQQMAKAVDDGNIKCFNLLEGAADGEKNLNLQLC
jgi:hypothetical protein